MYKLLKSGRSFNAGTMAVFNFSRYFSPETVSLKNIGPTIPADDIPTQTIIPGWFSSVAIVKCGFLSLQQTQLWQFTCPESLKAASSVHTIWFEKVVLSSQRLTKCSQTEVFDQDHLQEVLELSAGCMVSY